MNKPVNLYINLDRLLECDNGLALTTEVEQLVIKLSNCKKDGKFIIGVVGFVSPDNLS